MYKGFRGRCINQWPFILYLIKGGSFPVKRIEHIERLEQRMEVVYSLFIQKEKGFIEWYEGYKKLLNIIEENERNGVCKLSKKKISELYGMSYTGTSRKMKFLLRYGLLKQVDSGFVRTETELINAVPFSMMAKLLVFKELYPSLRGNLIGLASRLSISVEDVQTIEGAWTFIMNHPKSTFWDQRSHDDEAKE